LGSEFCYSQYLPAIDAAAEAAAALRAEAELARRGGARGKRLILLGKTNASRIGDFVCLRVPNLVYIIEKNYHMFVNMQHILSAKAQLIFLAQGSSVETVRQGTSFSGCIKARP
jgi:hypothetical protein